MCLQVCETWSQRLECSVLAYEAVSGTLWGGGNLFFFSFEIFPLLFMIYGHLREKWKSLSQSILNNLC